jgi:hypothetical protein
LYALNRLIDLDDAIFLGCSMFHPNGYGPGSTHWGVFRHNHDFKQTPHQQNARPGHEDAGAYCRQSDRSQSRLPSVHRRYRVTACLSSYFGVDDAASLPR